MKEITAAKYFGTKILTYLSEKGPKPQKTQMSTIIGLDQRFMAMVKKAKISTEKSFLDPTKILCLGQNYKSTYLSQNCYGPIHGPSNGSWPI